MTSPRFFNTLLALLLLLAISQPASAAITLYDKEAITFTVDGFFNTFYVNSSSDNKIASPNTDRDQARIKMGFLPNYIGFNFSKQAGDLKLGGRSSFWVSINDSDDKTKAGDSKATVTGIDVRQFYGTVDAAWGQVLIGKDFGLFNRSNIFLDEILLGYGKVSDTLGLVDGGGVSFGNIGSGYIYPLPTAQITYRSPDVSGFKLAIGLLDPSHTAGAGSEENMPRIESELTFNKKIGEGSLTAWTNFMYQKSKVDSGKSVQTSGFGYGLQGKIAGFGLTASGFNASGAGWLAGPGGDTSLGLPVVGAKDEIDSNGYLVQGSYTYGPARLVASYGQTKVDYGTVFTGNLKDTTTTGAVFFAVNSALNLVAEYNVNEIKLVSGLKEKTNTIALGATLGF
ncbi:MAG TPA: porin [Desulfuromonadales bacterium]|nr:porin [Desulfuromonadales bacterium]